MSNQIIIERIKLKNKEQEGATISDNYGGGFVWFEEKASDDDLALIQQIQSAELDSNVHDIMNHLKEGEKGVNIDGAYYEYSEIEKVL